jgi:ArsR family transcriptional regulator, arsenate/arsenite/antimonite-responsive transcriptional repressor
VVIAVLSMAFSSDGGLDSRAMSEPLSGVRALPLAQPRLVTEPRNVTLEVFRALADPVRLELLAHVAARGPLCVCHLEDAVPYSQSRISKHLGVLRRAGLVSARRERNWVYYSVNTDALDTARDFLNQVEQSMALPHAADYCEPAADETTEGSAVDHGGLTAKRGL